jgi:predicted MFS family arabinose efflux permease
MRTILFSAAAFLAGGRTLISSAYALSLPTEQRAAAASVRASTMQFGYFIGSSVGGAALAVGGFCALGAVMASFFLLAAVSLVPTRRRVARAVPGQRVPRPA